MTRSTTKEELGQLEDLWAERDPVHLPLRALPRLRDQWSPFALCRLFERRLPTHDLGEWLSPDLRPPNSKPLLSWAIAFHLELWWASHYYWIWEGGYSGHPLLDHHSKALLPKAQSELRSCILALLGTSPEDEVWTFLVHCLSTIFHPSYDGLILRSYTYLSIQARTSQMDGGSSRCLSLLLRLQCKYFYLREYDQTKR